MASPQRHAMRLLRGSYSRGVYVVSWWWEMCIAAERIIMTFHGEAAVEASIDIDGGISRSDINVLVTLSRHEDPDVKTLRCFAASVVFDNLAGSGEVTIGSVSGWMSWDVESDDLVDEGDGIDADAMTLAWAADQIIDSHWAHRNIDVAILINRMHLDEAWRGHRLSGIIIDRLLEVLQLDPQASVVVLQPEPLGEGSGSPFSKGPERDEALQRLQSAYRMAGLEPWEGGDVWWASFEKMEDEEV